MTPQEKTQYFWDKMNEWGIEFYDYTDEVEILIQEITQ